MRQLLHKDKLLAFISNVEAFISQACIEAKLIFLQVWDFVNMLLNTILIHYLHEWLTKPFCDFLSKWISFVFVLLLLVKTFAIVLNLISKMLNAISEKIGEGVRIFTERILQSLWFLISFIPKSIWNTIFPSQK